MFAAAIKLKTQQAGSSGIDFSLAATENIEHTKFNEQDQTNDDLLKLIRRQRALTRSITRLLREVETRLITNLSYSTAYCEYKISTLLKYQNELFNNNQEIWELISDEAPYEYTKETYHQTDSWIQEAIIALQERLQTTNNSSTTNINIRLPKVSIPVFDGNYLHWTQFKDLYTQMIHVQQIRDTEKMFYLMNNRIGEARGLIQHLSHLFMQSLR